MSIKELIKNIRKIPNCIIHPPYGFPRLEHTHVLPDDIREFYSICGGAELFSDSDYSITIVPPNKFELANPVIIGEKAEYDISSDWYIVGYDKNNDYITVDLNEKRVGKCYDSFWDRHGVVGECSIIATSFTDLLERLIKSDGQNFYWLQEDFLRLGDAYDE